MYTTIDIERRQQELWREAERRRLVARIQRQESAATSARRSTLRLRAILAR